MPTNEQKEIVNSLLKRVAPESPETPFGMRLLVDYVAEEFVARKMDVTRLEISEMIGAYYLEKNSGQ